jgi:PAS domain S-box-containing protein
MESELRASQAELRHQRDLLDRVVDNAPTGTALVAPDGTWLRCNAALAGIVGYSEAELLGSTFQDITHPDDLDVDLGYVRQMLDGEIRTYQMEKRYIHKDGRIVWIRLSVSLVRDDRGEPMLFISQIEDITAWKDHAAELETRVRERTVELEAVNRELESFSYSVSHDLRGPLRAIDGFGKALTTMHRDELSADAVHKLDRIRAAAQRMGELIDELLVLAGLTRRAMHLEHVDLSELAREIVEALRSREPTRSVVVEVEDGMECEGDSTLLRTVVENLLGNAWKFTSDTEDARIRFGVERVAGREEYVVSDNGAGFDMAHGEKLFAPFERLHRQDEFPGTGVGLTSVERIVRRHGGTITAHGEVGAGASIRFTINSRRTGVR